MRYIQVLTLRQAVRNYPERVFRVTRNDPRLPATVLWWVVRSVLHSAEQEDARRVTVVVDSAHTFSVADDGRGTDKDLLAVLTAGFCGHPRGDLDVVTAICDEAQADVWRDGRHWRQTVGGEPPWPPLEDLGPTTRHGTRLWFHLSPEWLDGNILRGDVAGVLSELRGDLSAAAEVALVLRMQGERPLVIRPAGSPRDRRAAS